MTAAESPLDTRPLDAGPTLLRSLVRRLLWPGYVAAVFAAIAWAHSSGSEDVVRASLAIGTLLVVMSIEQLVPRYAHRGIRSDPQVGNDIGLLLGNGLVEALFATATFVPALWVASQLSAGLGFSIWPAHWPWAAQALLAFLSADLLDYFVHRASHRVPWLWSIHVLHHDTDRLHVIKGARNHPFATLVRIIGVYLPLVALGAPVAAVFSYQVFITSIGSLSHANLDMRFPAFLHRFLVTPPVHRIHHARAATLHDRNFGAFTTAWDRLFDTYEAPSAGVDPDFGLEEGSAPRRFLAQLAWPFTWWR